MNKFIFILCLLSVIFGGCANLTPRDNKQLEEEYRRHKQHQEEQQALPDR